MTMSHEMNHILQTLHNEQIFSLLSIILENSKQFIQLHKSYFISYPASVQCSGKYQERGNFITFSIETKQNEFLQHKNLEFQILFDMKNKYFKHSFQILFLETHTCSLS